MTSLRTKASAVILLHKKAKAGIIIMQECYKLTEERSVIADETT